MVKINKTEAEFLRENKRGEDIHISSLTHTKKYYLTESRESMQLLNRYRKDHVVWSSEKEK